MIPDQQHRVQYNFVPFYICDSFFLIVRNGYLYSLHHPCMYPSPVHRPTSSQLALTSCLDTFHLNSWFQSWAALHYCIGTLLYLGSWNSLWTNFPHQPDSLLVSFGLWFSTLGLHLSLTTYRPPRSSSTELSCKGKGKKRRGSERALARRNRCGEL